MSAVEDLLRRSACAGAPPLERLLERAADDGLVDVAYAEVDSPLGPLLVASTPKGLVRVAYPDQSIDDVLGELSRLVSPRVLEAPARLERERRQLDDYFAGRRTGFNIPVDWSLERGFTLRVLRAAARIPPGETISYGEIATRAGSPRAARAAGNALGSNRKPIVVPCHRVVHAGGGLGGYTGGLHRKEFLLGLEGLGGPGAEGR
ncbi:MAG TPA: methylated-DNA--[protein]-cysteine S-methyltransferase [Thermoleophilaceae bacterium]|nr:methylated-DNA--[protein]-cysteine S-methyltransferase [Thermoleophilaceae bacterium]